MHFMRPHFFDDRDFLNKICNLAMLQPPGAFQSWHLITLVCKKLFVELFFSRGIKKSLRLFSIIYQPLLFQVQGNLY